jgi:transposase
MTKATRYPAELRERAMRLVREHRGEYPSEWAAIQSVAAKLGIGAPETLRTWIRRAEVDGRQRPGLTTPERERLVQLERENRELRRANEILKAAAAFFASMSTMA